MKNCIYIAFGASLPNQNASALRVSSIIDALIDQGYCFDAIGQAPANTNEVYTVKNGYDIHPTYNTSKNNSVFEKIFAFIFPTHRIMKKIKMLMLKKQIDYIFVYQVIPSSLMRKIIRLSKKNDIKIVFDIVEFQNFSQQRDLIGVFCNYIPARRIIKKYSKSGVVISITTFLRDLFIKQQTKSIFVPFFFDVNTMINSNYKKSDLIRIIYAGAPFGSRDTIINAVKGLLLLDDKDRCKFSLTFAGVTREQMRDLGLTNDELIKSDNYCHYLGRVKHEKVIELYSNSDYSLLLKPENKRLSKAGFPTKVSESWALSTPVIANITGDMDLFMKDMYNGIVAKSDSPLDFSNALKCAMSLSDDEYLKMRKNSRKTAVDYLDKTVFSKQIKEFIENN